MVAAVLLAAGRGTRFTGPSPKLLAELRGRPVLAHALDAALASALDLYVVTGAVAVDHLVPPSATTVANPRWSEGQATSVRAGIGAAAADGHDAVVVGLGDQPFVTEEAWRWVAESSSAVAVATYDGARGHPVRLGSEVWDLLPVTGDEVGRQLMRARPELVTEIPCEGSPTDIDTLEDLHRWS